MIPGNLNICSTPVQCKDVALTSKALTPQTPQRVNGTFNFDAKETHTFNQIDLFTAPIEDNDDADGGWPSNGYYYRNHPDLTSLSILRTDETA